MIRRVTTAAGVRFEVYGQKPPCTSPCKHKECAAGRTRKAYVGSFDSKREAESADRRHVVTQEQIASGELPPEVDLRRTLKQATDEWLTALLEGKSRSHRPYSEFLRYQILPTLADVPIAKFNRRMIEQWRDETAKKYAGTSVNSALGCLSSAFSWFVDSRQWLPANPCIGVTQVPQAQRQHNWIRTRGELERLLSVCPDTLRDMIAISVGTMLRIGELLQLQWDDVSIRDRLITVQRGGQDGTTKSGRIRIIPILDGVLPVFQRLALQRAGNVLVFPGKRGAVRTQSPVTCAFKAALRRAGMDETLNWHALRHTGATWWVIGGGDIFRLSKMMGHRDVKVTQRTYAHWAPEAWTQDYHRLAFHCPSEPAKVYEAQFDERGKLTGKRAVAPVCGESAESAPIALVK